MAPFLLLALISLSSYGSVVSGDPVKGCGNNPADIVFVLDESGSIWGPHFTQQLEFVQSVISSFDIGFNKTHVGVLTFGTNNRVIFPLGQYTDEAQLNAAVKSITQKRGETYTHLALKRTREEMFSPRYSRPWVRHVAIVITDGESNYPRETEKEARLCHDANIETFAIGVGTAVARKELEAIASSSDLVFTVNSYAALDSLRQILAWKACQTTTIEPPTTTTSEPLPQMIEGCNGHAIMDHIWSISDLAGVSETNHALDFIKQVTETMTIDNSHIQVGLTPRICEEGKEIRLKDHDTRDGFWRGLDRRRLTGLRVDRTIEYIRQKGLSSENGARQDSVKFGILIVDNQVKDWEKTYREAVLAKNEGVRLIVIGVGDALPVQLRELASSGDHYFSVKSYSALSDMKTDLIRSICAGITAGKNQPRDFFESFFDE